MPKFRGDELVDSLCAPEIDKVAADSIANELLTELYRGYPVARLHDLLTSEQVVTIRSGVWIASEVGIRAAVLLADIDHLLDHHDRFVRFFAVDVVLASATGEHAATIAKAINLLLDQDEAVRWKVLHLLSNATQSQLSASLPYLSTRLKALTEWLCHDLATEEVLVRFDHEELSVRLFAVAAAARVAAMDPSLLERAAASKDDEISTFARERLALSASRKRT